MSETTELQRSRMGISTDKFHATATGLRVIGEPSYEEWYDFGHGLAKMGGAIQWWIGDWATAEGRVINGVKSEAYSLLEQETGLKRKTVQNNKYVAENVELSCRQESLSFEHHAAIAPLQLEDQERWLQKAVDEGLSVAQLRRAIKADAYEEPVLPDGVYRIIYADPPWEYRNSGFEMSAAQHFPTMTTEQICALKVPAADNAVCFMWVTNPLLPDGLKVVDAWGFEYKTNLVWVKDNHTAGFYVYGQHELLMIGIRGEGMLPVEGAKPKSVITGANDVHSKKPDVVYGMIDAMYPDGNRLEMFARQRREGWEAMGNEI